MRAEVIMRQRKAMTKAGFDALVAISPENFAYTTGFVVPSQPLMRWRHTILLSDRTDTNSLFVIS